MTVKTLAGKKALVTGGTRGIGQEIASHLADSGAEVWGTGTKKEPSRTHYFSVDFSSIEQTKSFVELIKDEGFDIVVNNAGINSINNFLDIDPKTFLEIQQVNLTAPFLISQAALAHMTKNRWGRIVNITSIFSIITKEMRASYSASKFGMVGMSKAMAVEVAKSGILVNCVAPGFIDTDLTRKILGAEGIEKLVSQVPIGRLGTATEIAKFVSWLAGPENTFITGQNIAIDGGLICV